MILSILTQYSLIILLGMYELNNYTLRTIFSNNYITHIILQTYEVK